MSDIQKSLGERIRTFRKIANLTQEKVAEKASISAYYIGQIERGEASPSLSAIQDIANALDVRVRDLFRFPSEEGTSEEIIDEIVALLRTRDWSIEKLVAIRNLLEIVGQRQP